YGWEKFRADARRSIEAYLKVWRPKDVGAASLHYIDMFIVPGEAVRLEDYFNFYPVLPPLFLERQVRNLALAFQFAGDAEGETLAVSFRHEGDQEGQLVSRLQWDYFATRAYSATVTDMMNWLENAHRRTSEAFRASLTPICEALFERE